MKSEFKELTFAERRETYHDDLMQGRVRPLRDYFTPEEMRVLGLDVPAEGDAA